MLLEHRLPSPGRDNSLKGLPGTLAKRLGDVLSVLVHDSGLAPPDSCAVAPFEGRSRARSAQSAQLLGANQNHLLSTRHQLLHDRMGL